MLTDVAQILPCGRTQGGAIMPTYIYRCRQCDDVFEEVQRITAEPGATCSACGHGDCVRQITGGTFHLKGSGWHASDYGTKGAPAEETPAACPPEAAASCTNADCPAPAEA